LVEVAFEGRVTTGVKLMVADGAMLAVIFGERVGVMLTRVAVLDENIVGAAVAVGLGLTKVAVGFNFPVGVGYSSRIS